MNLRKLNNQKGFTLIELMLAMAISVTVLIIATVGFVGINRTFSRGLIRRQLSEGVQRITEDVTQTVRAAPTQSPSGTCFLGLTSDTCPPGTQWGAQCLANTRYLWRAAGGLYKDSKPCPDAVVEAELLELIDDRFVVEGVIVEPLAIPNLYHVLGLIRTPDRAAFVFPEDVANDDVVSPLDTRCRGTAESNAVRTCSIESFDFIVSSKGGTL